MVSRISTVLIAVSCFLLGSAAGQTDLDALIEAGHFKQVERALDASKSRDPETLYLLSKVKQSFGKTGEAVSLAEQAVKADPNKAKYHLQLADVLSDQAQTAGMFKKMSLAGRIHSELDTAVKLEPKNPDCLFGLMLFYQQAPGIAGGSKEKARQEAEEIAKIDASRGYLAQAQLARGNKQNDRLEDLYLKAVKADPRSVEALTALASFYASQMEKKYEVADRYARQALDLDKTRIGPYVVCAEVAVAKQDWARLDEILSESEQANGDDLNPFYQAGRGLLQMNREIPKAEQYFRKYLSEPPEGFAPPLSAAHWRLGLVLEKLGRKADAIAQMEEALRLQPDFENAKKDLKRLKG